MELRYEVSLNFYFCTFYLRYVENENLIMMNDDLFLFLARNVGIEFVRFERKDCSNSSHGKLHCNRLIETRASIKRGPAFVTTAYPNSLNSVWDRVAQCRSRKCLTGDRRLRYPVTRSFSSFFFFLTRLTDNRQKSSRGLSFFFGRTWIFGFFNKYPFRKFIQICTLWKLFSIIDPLFA